MAVVLWIHPARHQSKRYVRPLPRGCGRFGSTRRRSRIPRRSLRRTHWRPSRMSRRRRSASDHVYDRPVDGALIHACDAVLGVPWMDVVASRCKAILLGDRFSTKSSNVAILRDDAVSRERNSRWSFVYEEIHPLSAARTNARKVRFRRVERVASRWAAKTRCPPSPIPRRFARAWTHVDRASGARIHRSIDVDPTLVRRARRRRPARARAPRTSDCSVHARARDGLHLERGLARETEVGSASLLGARFARRTTTRSGRRSTGTESPPSSGVQRLGRRGGTART